MDPVHIATMRKMKPDLGQAFEKALRAFVGESLQLPGTTGVHVVAPAYVFSREFGILRSFVSASARDNSYNSELYAKCQNDDAPMIVGEPRQT